MRAWGRSCWPHAARGGGAIAAHGCGCAAACACRRRSVVDAGCDRAKDFVGAELVYHDRHSAMGRSEAGPIGPCNDHCFWEIWDGAVETESCGGCDRNNDAMAMTRAFRQSAWQRGCEVGWDCGGPRVSESWSDDPYGVDRGDPPKRHLLLRRHSYSFGQQCAAGRSSGNNVLRANRLNGGAARSQRVRPLRRRRRPYDKRTHKSGTGKVAQVAWSRGTPRRWPRKPFSCSVWSGTRGRAGAAACAMGGPISGMSETGFLFQGKRVR